MRTERSVRTIAQGTNALASSIVLVCRKRCKSEIAPEDILQQETIDKNYANRDFHAMYIGEIVAAYKG